MTTVVFIVRFALAALFAVAGISKLANRAQWRETLSQLVAAKHLAAPLVFLIPLAELAVAALLAVGPTSRWGGLAAALMLGVFAVGVAVAVRRGRTPECNCFGQIGSSRLSWQVVVRNLGFAALAVLVFVDPTGEPSANLLIGLAVGMAFGLQSWFCFQLLKQNGRILARLERLETPQSPLAALPVGAPAPDFVLGDLDGTRVSLAGLISARGPVLLAFVDPQCAPCQKLMPEFGAWEGERGLRVAVISSGDPGDNRRQLEIAESQTLLLQHDREVALSYGIAGTPAAVLVAPDGRIASQLALGAPAIRALADATANPSSPVLAQPVAGVDTSNGRTEHDLRFAGGTLTAAAAVGTAVVGASSAAAQGADPGIEEIRAKLAAALPAFVDDFDALEAGLGKLFRSKRRYPATGRVRTALAAQRERAAALQADLATVTAESGQAQAVRDAAIRGFAFQVQGLDEFDRMLGLRSKSKRKKSKKKAHDLLVQSRIATYYANVGLGCSGDEC